ncbi:putative ferric-chelate reductase 1 [Physella acuta]|uniref:putative ferric-chelate reductase 1 n=1 Tax=Physella acuta TaxID=109671 RepID=UPI0027DC1912|nr:putative ferric-chelate reductase 1 [Physella acuta]
MWYSTGLSETLSKYHMMSVLEKTLLFIVALCFKTGNCFPNGANVDSSCSNLVPQHGASSQTSTPPYKITFTPTSYTAGQTVSVTISANPSSFKGFMIQARRADGSSSERLGSFTPVANTQQACSGQALVHTNSDSKSLLTFNWTPASTYLGNVVFRVTYVQAERTFWANIASSTLTFVGSTSGPATQAPTSTSTAPVYLTSTAPSIPTAVTSTASAAVTNTAAPVSVTSTAPVITTSTAFLTVATTVPTAQSLGTVSADPTCEGSTKGCFTSCTGNTCKFIVSWKEDGTDVVYNFTAAVEFSDGSYVALGLSSDSSMGNDSVIGCAFGTDGLVVSFTAANVGKSSASFPDSSVRLLSGSYKNGILTCSVHRPIAGLGKRYDVSKPWTLLFASGVAYVDSVVSLTNHYSNNYISAIAVTSKYVGNVNVQEQDNPMYKAHGCLMVAAWMFFSSIGIITARFYKPVWKNTILSLKVWFQIHRLCMVLVFCLTAIGFIIIFVEEKDWSKVENEAVYLSGHPIIGVIVMILTVLNPVMSLFRCDPGTPKRPLFNWAHFIVGVSAHILAVIAIFFGVRLKGAATPYYTVYILGAYVAWILFVEILLELINCCDKRIVKQEVYEMGSSDNPKFKPPGTQSKKTILIKRVILVVHCVVVASLAAAVMAIIGVGEGSDS